jgi:16S rRNA G966 N2-methylase RsmD
MGYIEEALEIVGTVASKEALVVAERHVKDKAPLVPEIWQTDTERRYGDTLISVYSKS